VRATDAHSLRRAALRRWRDSLVIVLLAATPPVGVVLCKGAFLVRPLRGDIFSMIFD
jgi:hypothetical protein